MIDVVARICYIHVPTYSSRLLLPAAGYCSFVWLTRPLESIDSRHPSTKGADVVSLVFVTAGICTFIIGFLPVGCWLSSKRPAISKLSLCLTLLVYSSSIRTVYIPPPPDTYYWTVPLILDHSYLVGNLTNSKIAETKALEPLKSWHFCIINFWTF